MILTAFSCSKSRLSKTPKITYKSLFPRIVTAGASNERTTISFIIEDGDGDIGFKSNNIYMKDSRDSSTVVLQIPVIPTEYSPERGIKGTVVIDYLAALLILRPDTAHIESDTLHWEIFIKDEAGNMSNTIITEDLLLVRQ